MSQRLWTPPPETITSWVFEYSRIADAMERAVSSVAVAIKSSIGIPVAINPLTNC